MVEQRRRAHRVGQLEPGARLMPPLGQQRVPQGRQVLPLPGDAAGGLWGARQPVVHNGAKVSIALHNGDAHSFGGHLHEAVLSGHQVPVGRAAFARDEHERRLVGRIAQQQPPAQRRAAEHSARSRGGRPQVLPVVQRQWERRVVGERGIPTALGRLAIPAEPAQALRQRCEGDLLRNFLG
eukprot:11219690-Lingulodinium_polyedra.AAC.1